MQSVYRTQKAFVDAGHEVHYLYSGKSSQDEVYDGIHVHQFRVWCPAFPPSFYWLHRLSIKLYWVLFVLVGTFRAIRLAKAIRPAVVFGYSSYGIPAAYIAGKICGAPTVSRLFGTFLFPSLGSSISMLKKCEEVLAFRMPCKYLIITDDGTRGGLVARNLGVPPERIRFWRNGIDKNLAWQTIDRQSVLRALRLPEECRIVLWTSRLVSWKRADRLIRAVPEIVARLPDTRVVVIGEGDERKSLQELCGKLGATDYVRFLGAQSHADVPRFLGIADLFVSLFDFSNVSNAVLEAMICGRCVLALDTGDAGTVIRHLETGVLLKPDELESLAEVAARLLADDPLRSRLGANAREFAMKDLWSWEERMKAEVDLVENLVASGRG